MKICFSSTGKNLDSFVDPRFGRCQYLIFMETKNSKIIKAIANENAGAMRGAGITTAQVVASNKAEAVITGNIGPNAFDVLNTSKIKIYPGVFDLTVRQALEKYNQGELKEMQAPTAPGRFGVGGGRGAGFGRR